MECRLINGTYCVNKKKLMSENEAYLREKIVKGQKTVMDFYYSFQADLLYDQTLERIISDTAIFEPLRFEDIELIQNGEEVFL